MQIKDHHHLKTMFLQWSSRIYKFVSEISAFDISVQCINCLLQIFTAHLVDGRATTVLCPTSESGCGPAGLLHVAASQSSLWF